MCVKLDISHLALTAIEQSGVLAMLEGTAAAQVSEVCSQAFRILKGLVHRWLTDATANGNRQACVMLFIPRLPSSELNFAMPLCHNFGNVAVYSFSSKI